MKKPGVSRLIAGMRFTIGLRPHCWVLFLAIALLTSSVPALGVEVPSDRISAIRNAGESFEQAAAREGREFSPFALGTKQQPVQDVAEGYFEFDPSDVPMWETDDSRSFEVLTHLFEEIRDQRVYVDAERPDFNRRIAFLYPDDGCHVRGALFNQELEKRGLLRGHKIFAFGNLRVPTPHHGDGVVLWWFHVAPIFRMKSGLFVVDPALFPHGPVKLKDWLKFVAPEGDLMKLHMVTCDPFAHTPQSRCFGGSPGLDGGALRQHNEELLGYEWRRQVKLGRNPFVVLGDDPPWK